MLIPRILALVLVLTAPVFAAPPASPAASAQKKKVEIAPGTLVITRVENEILLAWAQPANEPAIRSQEVMRNNTTATAGRKRLAVLGAGAKTFSDFVPEGSEPFTYWIKVTRPDMTNYNIGPVTAPTLEAASATPAKTTR